MCVSVQRVFTAGCVLQTVPTQERLSDFHLLLWLSKQPNLDRHDMTLLVDAVKTQNPVAEGYRMIVDSIAGL